MRTSNIVQNSQTALEVGENAIPMRLDDASAVFLMDALGKLYSRPAQAVLREYLSNAVDAHKAKGGKLPPIQVTIPVYEGEVLTIRDFGKGMSEEEFSTILSRYGASTKRDSNEMIGGFGLGAKSGFALQNQFFMTSYQHGHGLKVKIYKDTLNRGFVEVMERFQTNEPDGMLVEIAIPKGNLGELSRVSLYKDFIFFLGYSPEEVTVTWTGDAYLVRDIVQKSVYDTNIFTNLELAGTTVGWVGNDYSNGRGFFALIGKVAYKIDISFLNSLKFSNKLNKDFAEALDFLSQFSRFHVIDIPIGSVDMPSAREELTYSERTLKTLNAVIVKYVTMLKQHFQKVVNSKQTEQEVLEVLSGLQMSGYPAMNELSWRGQVLGRELLGSSNMGYITFGHTSYGLTPHENERTKALSFAFLQQLSNKAKYGYGIYLIAIKSPEEKVRLNKLIDVNVVEQFLGLGAWKEYNDSNNVCFIMLPEGDPLTKWVTNYTSIEISALEAAKEKHQQKEQEKAKLAAEKARAEKAANEAKEREVQLQREAEAHRQLSFFYLHGAGRNVQQYRSKDFTAMRSYHRGRKYYYWSEEEIEQFATVTKGLRKISNNISGSPKTSLLFPFIATQLPNTFNSVSEIDKKGNHVVYLQELRNFLRLFIKADAEFIIVGKDRSLEKFKTEYPDIESGVLKVKSVIEAQLLNESSTLLTFYNTLQTDKGMAKTEGENLSNFIKALDDRQKAQIDERLLRVAKRFKATMDVPHYVGKGEHFLEVVKAFTSHASLREKSYVMDTDYKEIRNRYPLLLNSAFNKYSPETINHLLTYIKLCDEGAFSS